MKQPYTDAEIDVAHTPRAIVVQVRAQEKKLKFINEFNAAYDPLHFVLLFPRGELGWAPGITAIQSFIDLLAGFGVKPRAGGCPPPRRSRGGAQTRWQILDPVRSAGPKRFLRLPNGH